MIELVKNCRFIHKKTTVPEAPMSSKTVIL